MPVRLACPCIHPGCPALVPGAERHCPAHHRADAGVSDRQRGSAARRSSAARWRRVSLRYLQRHPLCVQCREEGYIVAAVVVAHVTPPGGDPALLWDEANFQPLCLLHHTRTSAGTQRR